MRSMTGYGKSESQSESYQLNIELKAVNHRYLDSQFRMPKEFNYLEAELKRCLKQKVSRGRVECFITYVKSKNTSQTISVNWDMLGSLVHEFYEQEISQHVSLNALLTGAVTHPDLFEVVEQEPVDEALAQDVVRVFSQAVTSLNESRELEGERLRSYMEMYQGELQDAIERIRIEAVAFQEHHQERLQRKLEELLDPSLVDSSRVLTEVALLVERGDIQEELDRLAIHVRKLSELMTGIGPVGKEMDFLIQEMNREINTIGSKSGNILIKEQVVQLKTTVEAIREQTQNIE